MAVPGLSGRIQRHESRTRPTECLYTASANPPSDVWVNTCWIEPQRLPTPRACLHHHACSGVYAVIIARGSDIRLIRCGWYARSLLFIWLVQPASAAPPARNGTGFRSRLVGIEHPVRRSKPCSPTTPHVPVTHIRPDDAAPSPARAGGFTVGLPC